MSQRFRIQEQQQFGGDGSGEKFLNTRKGERIPDFNQDEGTEKVAFGTRGGQGPANGTLTGNGKAGRKGDVWVEVDFRRHESGPESLGSALTDLRFEI